MFSEVSDTEEGVVAGESERNSVYASTVVEQMEDERGSDSVDSEDELMDDNVQTFINMALLQRKF